MGRGKTFTNPIYFGINSYSFVYLLHSYLILLLQEAQGEIYSFLSSFHNNPVM